VTVRTTWRIRICSAAVWRACTSASALRRASIPIPRLSPEHSTWRARPEGACRCMRAPQAPGRTRVVRAPGGPKRAGPGGVVVAADAWIVGGQEGPRRDREAIFVPYAVTTALLDL